MTKGRHCAFLLLVATFSIMFACSNDECEQYLRTIEGVDETKVLSCELVGFQVDSRRPRFVASVEGIVRSWEVALANPGCSELGYQLVDQSLLEPRLRKRFAGGCLEYPDGVLLIGRESSKYWVYHWPWLGKRRAGMDRGSESSQQR